MLTKSQIQQMKEDQLCKDVLIPLLRAMGFKKVEYYHGREGEKGKDIICWKEDDLGARRNLALVVKATNITGRANSNKGSAGEVITQIQQVFGSPFIDYITSESQDIHDCWVLTNKRFPKESRDAIRSALKSSNYERNVRYVDGNELWDQVEKYLGIHTVLGKLEDVQKTFNEFDSHYQPVANILDGKITIGLKEKFPGASIEKPLEFHMSFQFPKTPDGIKHLEKLQNHFSTGAPVTIPPEFIESIQVPESFTALYGQNPFQGATIEISPLPMEHHFIARVEFACDDDNFLIDNVDFQPKQVGKDEITLENIEKGTPINMRIVVTPNLQSAKVTFGWKLTNPSYSPHFLRDLLRLQRVISKPFTVRIKSKEFGFVVFEQKNERGITNPPALFNFEMMDALSSIQERTGNPIMVPIRELTREEVDTIRKLINVVRYGKDKRMWTEVSVVVSRLESDSLKLLENLNSSPIPRFLRLSGTEAETIFGVEVNLGRTETTFRSAVVSNMPEVINAFNASVDDIRLNFVAKEEKSEVETIYEDFSPLVDKK